MEITKKELYTIVFTAIHEISLAPTVKDIVIVSNTIKDELNKLRYKIIKEDDSNLFQT